VASVASGRRGTATPASAAHQDAMGRKRSSITTKCRIVTLCFHCRERLPPNKGKPMPSHKFNIGDAVLFNSRVSRNAPWGVYEVVKVLPGNGKPDYKSANEEHQRVARESELTRA
jgi:hypothetical protein